MQRIRTGENWSSTSRPTADKPLGLAKQLKDAQDKNRQLSDEAAKLEQLFNAEKAAKLQAVTKLETELKEAQERTEDIARREAERVGGRTKRTAEAAMNATQTNATGYRTELESQRKTVSESQKDRDAHFKELQRLRMTN